MSDIKQVSAIDGLLSRLCRHAAVITIPALLAACAAVPRITPPADPQVVAPAVPGSTAELPPAESPAATAPLSPDALLLQSMVAAQEKLYRAAAPLLINNAELCRNNSRNLLGFTAKNRYAYSSELAAAAEAVYGVGESLRVTAVLAGSGAERAGMRRGDVLLTVEGKNFPSGENAERQTAAMLGPLVGAHKSLKLGLQRDGLPVTVNVPLTHACAFSIELGNTDLVNAYGDGYRILITRGMLQAVKNDEELSAVIAKEMAHNILAHAARQNQSANIGTIIDNLVRIQPDTRSMVGLSGLRPLPPELDAAADRLSIYLLARAGHNLEHVIPFWNRMAADYPATMLNAYTALHPGIEERAAAMERAMRNIAAKRAANEPLMP